jgi:hypothetical protein
MHCRDVPQMYRYTAQGTTVFADHRLYQSILPHLHKAGKAWMDAEIESTTYQSLNQPEISDTRLRGG